MDLFDDFNNVAIMDYIEWPVLGRMTFGNARYLIRVKAETSGSISIKEHLRSIIRQFGPGPCTVLCTVTQIEGNAPG